VAVADSQPVTWLQIITLGIAILGLVLGAVTATLAILRHLSDRVVVSVQGAIAFPLGAAGVGPLHYAIKAYNGGRRPVTLVAAGFDLGEPGATLPITGFTSARLQDGEAVDAYMSITELALMHVSPQGPVRAAWFRDAGGKVHRVAIDDGHKLIEWARLDVEHRSRGAG
jgi:hypothetical protein